jgi:toxin-antitoxin system PIN domain toxin
VILDANVLLYAMVDGYPQHARIRNWLEAQLSEGRRLHVPWHSALAFLRISTNARAMEVPLTTTQAWEAMGQLLDQPQVHLIGPGPSYQRVLAGVLARHEPTGNLLMDASLAALALEHGLPMVSTDADFARFSEIVWIHPGREVACDDGA